MDDAVAVVARQLDRWAEFHSHPALGKLIDDLLDKIVMQLARFDHMFLTRSILRGLALFPTQPAPPTASISAAPMVTTVIDPVVVNHALVDSTDGVNAQQIVKVINQSSSQGATASLYAQAGVTCSDTVQASATCSDDDDTAESDNDDSSLLSELEDALDEAEELISAPAPLPPRAGLELVVDCDVMQPLSPHAGSSTPTPFFQLDFDHSSSRSPTPLLVSHGYRDRECEEDRDDADQLGPAPKRARVDPQAVSHEPTHHSRPVLLVDWALEPSLFPLIVKEYLESKDVVPSEQLDSLLAAFSTSTSLRLINFELNDVKWYHKRIRSNAKKCQRKLTPSEILQMVLLGSRSEDALGCAGVGLKENLFKVAEELDPVAFAGVADYFGKMRRKRYTQATFLAHFPGPAREPVMQVRPENNDAEGDCEFLIDEPACNVPRGNPNDHDCAQDHEECEDVDTVVEGAKRDHVDVVVKEAARDYIDGLNELNAVRGRINVLHG
ncbi:hypothetical protein GGF31_006275 [Allomyces arbusculus]|nr:hypothetical protein GGF31_006275 [Allomyces arbusculus]